MRISPMFCSLAFVLSGSLHAATTDLQAKCEEQLAGQQANLETGKLIGQLLGNEKLNSALSQTDTGCQKLSADGITSDNAEVAALDEKVQAVNQAKDAVLGLGKLFGK